MITLQLIDEATASGSRHAIACDDMEIDVKTFKCWKNDTTDKRKGPLSVPGNKLSDDEVAEVVRVSTSKEYMDLPPCQIVPLLADKGTYLASESTFYKILNAHNLMAHRGKAKPATHHRPAPLVATGPNQPDLLLGHHLSERSDSWQFLLFVYVHGYLQSKDHRF
ncbi:MAG: hypothetical protein NDI69_06640 [Bacteriovoracaceae bacterium]|nr:hypothetical protein [Bacteriovoracaceae bacterium]